MKYQSLQDKSSIRLTADGTLSRLCGRQARNRLSDCRQILRWFPQTFETAVEPNGLWTVSPK